MSPLLLEAIEVGLVCYLTILILIKIVGWLINRKK